MEMVASLAPKIAGSTIKIQENETRKMIQKLVEMVKRNLKGYKFGKYDSKIISR